MSNESSLFKDLKSSDGKSYATGLVRPKTTALFFDKIWYPSDMPEFENIPKSIKYIEKTPSKIGSLADKYIYNATRLSLKNVLSQNETELKKYYEEIKYLKKDDISKRMKQLAEKKDDSADRFNDLTTQDSKEILSEIEKLLDESISYRYLNLTNLSMPLDFNMYGLDLTDNDGYFSSYYRNRGIRAATVRLRTIDQINIVPIYFDYTDFEKYLINNDISLYMVPEQSKREALKRIFTKDTLSFDVIEACINSVPIIVEEKLTWKQVEETRKDKASIEKLSRFWRWANTDFTGKSRSEISDLLNKELDDYQFALKKHGISTTIGGFTTLLSGAATLVSAMSTIPADLTPASLSITAGLLAFSATATLDLLKCNRNPVAYIYDVIKKSKV